MEYSYRASVNFITTLNRLFPVFFLSSKQLARDLLSLPPYFVEKMSMETALIYSAEPDQIIEGQYVDPAMLMSLLRVVYGTSEEGSNNFRVEV